MCNSVKKNIILSLIVIFLFVLLFSFVIETSVFAEEKKVYIGGFPLGINMKTNGMIVAGKSSVLTKEGLVVPLENIDIRQGDILYSLNGLIVDSIDSIETQTCISEKLNAVILRNDEKLEFDLIPKFDLATGKKKIGLILQDSLNGIGTITYINPDNMRYGALGHPIIVNKNIEVRSGNVYECTIYGVNKGEKGSAGSLDGYYSIKNKSIGNLDKTNPFGIFGEYIGEINDLKKVEIGTKNDARCGKAEIYTTVDGLCPKLYDIEIIRVFNQNEPKDKSMVIRILDKELLEKTGGIVQGMSGSPIIQNGKLIGAITHVFINDPTKGYGIYLDWMINN